MSEDAVSESDLDTSLISEEDYLENEEEEDMEEEENENDGDDEDDSGKWKIRCNFFPIFILHLKLEDWEWC